MACQRLKQDYVRLKNDPVPFILAEPLSSNLYIWHYVIIGPPDSPYKGGYYQGKLVFPSEYPFKPPSIYMITPNGRFAVNTRLCLSISDYHPDTWNPAWSVSSILTGLLSFMLEEASTTGSIHTTTATKRALAISSLEFNLKNEVFCELFPELAKSIRREVDVRKELKHGSQNDSSELDPSMDPSINQFSTFSVIILFAVFTAIVRMVMSYLSLQGI